MTTVVTTNYRHVPLLRWHELTAKEQAEFDYLETEEDRDDAQFFRCRKWCHSLADFMRMEEGSASWWDGMMADSVWTGMLVKIVDDGDSVIIGHMMENSRDTLDDLIMADLAKNRKKV